MLITATRNALVLAAAVAAASLACSSSETASHPHAEVMAGAAGSSSNGDGGDPFASAGAAVPPGGIDYGAKVNRIAYHWVNAVSYSGYRDGQSQLTGVGPSDAQVAEDLGTLSKRWGLIRGYSASPMIRSALEAIRANALPLHVFLAAWIGKDQNANDREVEAAIALANDPRYSQIIAAVIVGNECQVSWSDHVAPTTELVAHVRHVKASVQQPVTVADNWYWWAGGDANGSAASSVANEVDFITAHFYPLMEEVINGKATGVSNANALAKTGDEYATLKQRYPAKYIAIGEAGWATKGAFSQTTPGEANEPSQKNYYEQLTDWASKNQVITFWFEAFDEQWKDPGGYGLEAHWGLFTSDRKPKLVLSGGS